MKEQYFFYHPCPSDGELAPEEAHHALRVLRLQVGDELRLMDGEGSFYRAIIDEASGRRCRYHISETTLQPREWTGAIHLAVAPTKNMDRMEWLAEKATEIGLDRLSLLDCRFSERREVKTERLERIIVAAMKQSRKAWKPQLDAMEAFQRFIERADLPAQRFIAHCYAPEDVLAESAAAPLSAASAQKPFLLDVLRPQTDALVLVGPEGDFSIDEVRAAIGHGFVPVSLGTSRLRTETAALAAVHMMRIANR